MSPRVTTGLAHRGASAPHAAVDPGAPGRAPGAAAAIYQNAPVGKPQVREVTGRVAIRGDRQLRMAGAQLRKTTDLLHTATVRGRESAQQPHQALRVPSQ